MKDSLETLTSYRYNILSIARLNTEINYWENTLASIDNLSMLQSDVNKINSIISDLIANLTLSIEECIYNRNICESIISNIQNKLYKHILYLKFIQGDTMSTIAHSINYTVRHTDRLLKKAIQQL